MEHAGSESGTLHIPGTVGDALGGGQGLNPGSKGLSGMGARAGVLDLSDSEETALKLPWVLLIICLAAQVGIVKTDYGPELQRGLRTFSSGDRFLSVKRIIQKELNAP